MTVSWNRVTRADVLRAIGEYDRLGPEAFFDAHGFAPTTTYDLTWDDKSYPPKAILGTPTNSPPGSSWPRVSSKAGSQVRSRCSGSSGSRSGHGRLAD